MLEPDAILKELCPQRPKIEVPQSWSDFAQLSVLVTGAGGSIGSAICRMLAKVPVRRIILAGRSELGLFELENELHASPVSPVIVDITDVPRLTNVMTRHKPDVVIHAGAHKHVPLCEANAGEAVKNNVFGTINVIDASFHANVKTVVIVSTDKAIQPTSVMGATKRAAEAYATWRSSHGMEIACVRFGNVLGSSGSVFGIFQRQIEKGEPITITDENMDRFMMSAQDAAALSIYAASDGTSGRIITVEMGTPVKIVDLARAMMKQAGKEVPIRFTGIRPGERLHEELHNGEMESLGGGVLAYPPERFSSDSIQRMTLGLREVVDAENDDVREALRMFVPEYAPSK